MNCNHERASHRSTRSSSSAEQRRRAQPIGRVSVFRIVLLCVECLFVFLLYLSCCGALFLKPPSMLRCGDEGSPTGSKKKMRRHGRAAQEEMYRGKVEPGETQHGMGGVMRFCLILLLLVLLILALRLGSGLGGLSTQQQQTATTSELKITASLHVCLPCCRVFVLTFLAFLAGFSSPAPPPRAL